MTPSQLGRTIRDARRTLGLRQHELAGVANVGIRFIVDLEGGKPTAHIGKTLAVLDALGCHVHIDPPSARRE